LIAEPGDTYKGQGACLDYFCEDKNLFMHTTVTEVIVTAETVEPVVTMVLDHTTFERTVGIVTMELFATPLKNHPYD